MRIYMLNPPYFAHFGREMRWQDTGRAGTLYYLNADIFKSGGVI